MSVWTNRYNSKLVVVSFSWVDPAAHRHRARTRRGDRIVAAASKAARMDLGEGGASVCRTMWHRQAVVEDSCRRSLLAPGCAGTWQTEAGRDGDGGWKEGKAGRDVT